MPKANPPMAVKVEPKRLTFYTPPDKYREIQMIAVNIGISTNAMVNVLINEALNARSKTT